MEKHQNYSLQSVEHNSRLIPCVLSVIFIKICHVIVIVMHKYEPKFGRIYVAYLIHTVYNKHPVTSIFCSFQTKSIRFLEKTKLVHPLDLKHVRKKNLNATDTRLLRENKIKNNNNFFKFFQKINSGSKYDMPDNSYKDFSSEKVHFSADRIDPADSHISHSSLRRLLTLIRTSSRAVKERNGCSNCDINENVRKRRDVPVSTGRPPDVSDITEGGLAEETKHMLVKHQTTEICDCGTNKKNISLGFKRTRSR